MSEYSRSYQGRFFDKLCWDGAALPRWSDALKLLPAPILDSDPPAIRAYWGAWEIAIKSMRSPTPESGFVSNHMYMEFSEAIFAHDTTFMVVFGRYGTRLFSAVESFDNFYVKQHPSGEICREIGCRLGDDYWPNKNGDPMLVERFEGHDQHRSHYWFDRPSLAEHPEPSRCAVAGLNDPSCMLWGEMESFALTGDVERLRRILPVHQAWYRAFQMYLRAESGFFVTDWASIDNHSRNEFLGYGIDVICQVIHLAQLLCELSELTGDSSRRAGYESDIAEMKALVSRYMWDEERGFFYDLDGDLTRVPIKSALGFWPLLIEAAEPYQVALLQAELENPETFKSRIRVPSLAMNEPDFTELGSYFRGGVWAFTNHMIIRGLERSGGEALAREIALNHWRSSVQVYSKTGTVWEFLQPNSLLPGEAADADNQGERARPDFAGWGALPVIGYLLEYAVGLKTDAAHNTLTWHLTELSRCGCERFAFGDVVTDIVAASRSNEREEPQLELTTNRPYTLILNWGKGCSKRFEVTP